LSFATSRTPTSVGCRSARVKPPPRWWAAATPPVVEAWAARPA
jgi:hypothetical protein